MIIPQGRNSNTIKFTPSEWHKHEKQRLQKAQHTTMILRTNTPHSNSTLIHRPPIPSGYLPVHSHLTDPTTRVRSTLFTRNLITLTLQRYGGFMKCLYHFALAYKDSVQDGTYTQLPCHSCECKTRASLLCAQQQQTSLRVTATTNTNNK